MAPDSEKGDGTMSAEYYCGAALMIFSWVMALFLFVMMLVEVIREKKRNRRQPDRRHGG